VAINLVDGLVTRQAQPTVSVLHLFRGPYITDAGGRIINVPASCKRLLVFIALHRDCVERRYAAGALWPVGDECRASGNLRSALWRLNRTRIDVICSDKHTLQLRSEVLVDVHLVEDWASRVISGTARQADLYSLPTGINSMELLPGWYEDWVMMERERIRQRILHALESMSFALAAAGRHAQAVDAAMLAVRAEPLRESAQRALLEAHLAAGNWIEGRRSLESYRRLLLRELGVTPDPSLEARLRQGCSRERTRRSDAAPFTAVGMAPAAGA